MISGVVFTIISTFVTLVAVYFLSKVYQNKRLKDAINKTEKYQPREPRISGRALLFEDELGFERVNDFIDIEDDQDYQEMQNYLVSEVMSGMNDDSFQNNEYVSSSSGDDLKLNLSFDDTVNSETDRHSSYSAPMQEYNSYESSSSYDSDSYDD